ncbi:MAG: serine/threonine-protein kinase, partial [Polyangiales bacterium]
MGRYVVLKHLASGGMADVLLARSDGIEGFERHVVLKRIRAEHAKDQRFIDMFLDEARLAANLHHSNIVQVHDIGEASGEYFFAMEYLHGEDLRTMLTMLSKTKTHMPLQHVIAIVSAAAAGLHYAHERRGPDKKPLNIVHRDVSPSNILVGYDGSVKVVDFGIAKAALNVETRSGSLKGKVSYMSPEQCKSLPTDRRSDVYALGVVLYELATTTRLFKSDSDYLVMDAICTGKIPLPRVRRPDLPNELSTIIMTALSTDPARRYHTAEELRDALDRFAQRQGLSANPGAIATYLTKMFGERPEPWLDISPGETKTSPQAETVANGDLRGRSYTDLPLPAPDQTKIGTGSGVRAARTAAESMPSTISASRLSRAAIEPTKPARVDDRTSTRMAWEHEGTAPAPVVARIAPAKIAMIAVPVLLL